MIYRKWEVLDARANEASVYELQVIQIAAEVKFQQLIKRTAHPGMSKNLLVRPLSERAMVVRDAEEFVQRLETQSCVVKKKV